MAINIDDLSPKIADRYAAELLVIRKQARRKMSIARDNHTRAMQIENENYQATLEAIHLETETAVRHLCITLGIDPPP